MDYEQSDQKHAMTGILLTEMDAHLTVYQLKMDGLAKKPKQTSRFAHPSAGTGSVTRAKTATTGIFELATGAQTVKLIQIGVVQSTV